MSSDATQSDRGSRTGKMSVTALARMKLQAEKIAAVTAYDTPSGRLADLAGVDCVLVGDSAVMTMFGRDSTVSASMDEMLLLTRAVTRGVRQALVIADMPYGSYQVSDVSAVEHATRFVEAGADAVKLEGAGSSSDRVVAIAAAGIPVVGHLGLTPQTAAKLGGFKAQGRTADQAERLREDAITLERAGCCAIVLEAIPEDVAGWITQALAVPTIGIGAGARCDGQILVWHDLLGLTEGHVPRFVKRYAELGDLITAALSSYVTDVRTSRFPEPHHTYSMPAAERERFEALAGRPL